jgi:fatty acid desaturase
MGAYHSTAKANATANVARNVWSYAIIFCGYFPDQTYTFSEAEVEDESQSLVPAPASPGAANIEGSLLFQVASGNLGYQVEHHLFPDLPSTRYAEAAPQVKDICERYGLPYNRQRPLLPAAGDGAADDPASGVRRRRGPAEARSLPPEQTLAL